MDRQREGRSTRTPSSAPRSRRRKPRTRESTPALSLSSPGSAHKGQRRLHSHSRHHRHQDGQEGPSSAQPRTESFVPKSVQEPKRAQNQRILRNKNRLRRNHQPFAQLQIPSNVQNDSDSDNSSGSADEAYPRNPSRIAKEKVFTDKLSLFSPQKRIPKRVSREAVIDTIFKSLFDEKKRNEVYRAWDDTDTETDEEIIKKGLEIALSRELSDETLYGLTLGTTPSTVQKSNMLYLFVDIPLIRKLVNELRFEDARTTSARIPILRAIYKKCPHLRDELLLSLLLATSDRLQALAERLSEVYQQEIDGEKVDTEGRNGKDHGHGLTEFLRFIIEETFSGHTPPVVGKKLNFDAAAEPEPEFNLNTSKAIDYLVRTLVLLCRSHLREGLGTDEDELISCAGQFVMYYPPASLSLLSSLLKKWPSRSSEQEVFFLRLCARLLMVSPRLDTLRPQSQVHKQIMKKICGALTCAHVQVAREALSILNSQFILNVYIIGFPPIFDIVRTSLHQNAAKHWNSVIRELSDEQFDMLLDYA